ncbi:hypothetical protein Gohar_002730 [Gossypium harknessii]|uniref:DUF4283 domain-containing protein n=1 Tax=Gossypium harknessii TaxID=34285 RepID=A0A7J9HLR7_9ROSI|nr:hypothetical protein [Gossypium harknessii]
MEDDLADLSLDDGEDEILVVKNDPKSQSEVTNLYLILDIGDKRFLFPFFHRMDLERIINGAPWTFKNHLLVFHRLEVGEDLVNVPLTLVNFWVQVRKLLMGVFSVMIGRQLGDFIGNFLEYNSKSLNKGVRNFLRIRVRLDVWRPLKRKTQIMVASGGCTYVSFKFEKLNLFCFYYGRLGHSDSFCQIRMSKGEESFDMDWDLMICAPSRHVATMSSVWLVEDGDGEGSGSNMRQSNVGSRREGDRRGFRMNLDPVLGVNLVGDENNFFEDKGKET